MALQLDRAHRRRLHPQLPASRRDLPDHEHRRRPHPMEARRHRAIREPVHRRRSARRYERSARRAAAPGRFGQPLRQRHARARPPPPATRPSVRHRHAGEDGDVRRGPRRFRGGQLGVLRLRSLAPGRRHRHGLGRHAADRRVRARRHAPVPHLRHFRVPGHAPPARPVHRPAVP